MSRSVLLLDRPSIALPPPWPIGDDPILDTDYFGFCRRESERRGIMFAVSRVVAEREGGLTEAARVGDFSGPPYYSGISWYAFQAHYGGIGPEPWQDYTSFGHTAGQGNGFTAKLFWKPGDPRAWRDAMRYQLDLARASGWGPWYGAAAAGIFGFHGIDRSVPWGGTPADEWDAPSWASIGETPMWLAVILEEARKETGKRYAGPVIDEPDWMRWGNPGWDCSSFVSAAYARGRNVALTAFSDAIARETDLIGVDMVLPGDLVLWRYHDPGQPGVTYPHVSMWLDGESVVDCRWPEGSGAWPMLDHPCELSRARGI